MAKCAKCSAELLGLAKFCSSCGAPVAQPGVDVGYAPPLSQVNPFAATASPVSKKPASVPPPAPHSLGGPSEATPPTWESGTTPPGKSPSAPAPGMEGSQVSPLAVSGALSQRGAFQQAVESALDKARSSVTPPPAPVRAKKPGTHVMAHAPGRGVPSAASPTEGNARPPAPEPPPAVKAPPRTIAMNFSAKPALPAQPGPNSAGAPNTTPSAGAMYPQSAGTGQPHIAQPQHAPQQGPASQVAQPQAGAPYPQAYPHSTPHGQQPANPTGWGWNPPAMPQPVPAPHVAPAPQAAGGYSYPFGYSPGSRVQVTWSNGQRYPATVSQVSGSQCLVVFPDGQQHWVEMMYISPS